MARRETPDILGKIDVLGNEKVQRSAAITGGQDAQTDA
jgi:hypothetical protein